MHFQVLSFTQTRPVDVPESIFESEQIKKWTEKIVVRVLIDCGGIIHFDRCQDPTHLVCQSCD